MQGSPTCNLLFLLFILSGGKTHGRIICKNSLHALLNMDRSVNNTTADHLSRQSVRFLLQTKWEERTWRKAKQKAAFLSTAILCTEKCLATPITLIYHFFYVIGNSYVKLKGVKVTLNVSSLLWTLRVPRRTTLALIFDGVSFCGGKKALKKLTLHSGSMCVKWRPFSWGLMDCFCLYLWDTVEV